MSGQSTLEMLPDELLLTITSSLDTPGLKNLCLVNRKARPIAQDVLYRDINFSGLSHYHPGVNRMMNLLRTLLSRPDLALKVDNLVFWTVRKNFRKQYEDHAFDFAGLRKLCMDRLKELGHGDSDPWHMMFKASIESAFAGLLLTLVPNLTTLGLYILDNHHGLYTYEPLSALFGAPLPVNAVLPVLSHLKRLCMPSVHLPLLAFDLAHLTELEMNKVTTIQMSRLNGTSSLAGGSKLKKLKLEAVVQLMDADHVNAYYIAFADLLASLGNPHLTNLNIHFFSEACPHGSAKLDIRRFLQELDSVTASLEVLKFWLRYDCSHGDCEWILENVKVSASSLQQFTSLKYLSLPESFLFGAHLECESIADMFPPSLEFLEIIYPSPATMDILVHVANERTAGNLVGLDDISLTCCGRYNLPAEFFWAHDLPIVREAGMEVSVYCQEQDIEALLGSEQNIPSSDEDEDVDDDDDVPDEEEDSDLEDFPIPIEQDVMGMGRCPSTDNIEVAGMD